jgi:hypothetical protein
LESACFTISLYNRCLFLSTNFVQIIHFCLARNPYPTPFFHPAGNQGSVQPDPRHCASAILTAASFNFPLFTTSDKFLWIEWKVISEERMPARIGKTEDPGEKQEQYYIHQFCRCFFCFASRIPKK